VIDDVTVVARTSRTKDSNIGQYGYCSSLEEDEAKAMPKVSRSGILVLKNCVVEVSVKLGVFATCDNCDSALMARPNAEASRVIDESEQLLKY
jgi:hypothetical protein